MSLILSGTDGLSDIDGSAATPAIRGTDANTGIFFPAADTIAFSEGGAEVMRIDSSGNVGIGITPSAWGTGYKVLQIGAAGALWSPTAASSQVLLNANSYFDGTNYKYINTNSATDYSQNAGTHIWRTAASGTAGNTISFTERMRIDSSGNLLVGTTSTPSSSNAGWGVIAGTALGFVISAKSVTSTAEHYQFLNPNGKVGAISTNGSSTTYSTSSDYRLKENIAPMTGALAKVAQLKPVTYNWKADGSDGQGFIAHELQAVVPECVTGEKDAVDAEGNPVYQGIDTSFLVATLTAAIQEQQAIIQSLTTRLTALENK